MTPTCRNPQIQYLSGYSLRGRERNSFSTLKIQLKNLKLPKNTPIDDSQVENKTLETENSVPFPVIPEPTVENETVEQTQQYR